MNDIQVALLGEVTVRAVHGAVIPVQGRRQRTLLALLALNLDHPVSIGGISDALWNGDPPPSARATVRGYVRRLRSALEPGAGSRFAVIASSPAGYRMRAASVEVDLATFRTWRSRAAACSDPAQEASLLHRSLTLWRGRPLSGLGENEWAEPMATALEEEMLQAAERRCDLLLAGRDFGAAAVETQRLLVQHPLRESLWHRLIDSLHRGGRTAEALLSYEKLRRQLNDALGVEPSAPIRALHATMLRADAPAASLHAPR